MGINKFLGPDNITVEFFKAYWNLIIANITRVAFDFLSFHKQRINILDSKIQEPRCAKYYRPISLRNVFFKLISKTMANILRKVLPSLSVVNQSTFLVERQIFDSFNVAYEMLHVLRNKSSGAVGKMALKLDM